MRVKEIFDKLTNLPKKCKKYLIQKIKENPNITLKEVAKIIPEREGYYLFRELKDNNIIPDYISRKIMMSRIKSSQYAYYWAEDTEDKEINARKIKTSQYAYYWTKHIGDRKIMRDKIKSEKFIKLWLNLYPEDEKYFKREE